MSKFADLVWKAEFGHILVYVLGLSGDVSLSKGCGPEDASIVSGEVYNDWFSVSNILRHDKTESHNATRTNIWIPPGNNRDFVLNHGCSPHQVISAIQLVNARNRNKGKNSGVRRFRYETKWTSWNQALFKLSLLQIDNGPLNLSEKHILIISLHWEYQTPNTPQNYSLFIFWPIIYYNLAKFKVITLLPRVE